MSLKKNECRARSLKSDEEAGRKESDEGKYLSKLDIRGLYGIAAQLSESPVDLV